MAGPTRELDLYVQAATDAAAPATVTVAGTREVDVYAVAVTDAGTPLLPAVPAIRALDTYLFALTDAPATVRPSVDPARIADIYAQALTNATTIIYLAELAVIGSGSAVTSAGGNYKYASLAPTRGATAITVGSRVHYRPGVPVTAHLDELHGATEINVYVSDNGTVYSRPLAPVTGVTAIALTVTGPHTAVLDPVDGDTGLTFTLIADLGAVLDPVDGKSSVTFRPVLDAVANGLLDGKPVSMSLLARAGLLILPSDAAADSDQADTTDTAYVATTTDPLAVDTTDVYAETGSQPTDQLASPTPTPTPTPTPPPPSTEGFTLPAWSDTFTGTTINAAVWNVRSDYQSNHYGFNQPANVTVESDGLHITAKRQTGLPGQPGSKPYTTGYIDTIGKRSQSTGRWEIDATLPTFEGAWPAFWLRCNSTEGEIDILECVGGLPHKVIQTVHQSTNGTGDKSGFEWNSATFDPAVRHTYALERAADGTVRWLIDGVLTRQRTPADIDNQHNAMGWLAGSTFASPLNLRINLQVGGAMPSYYGHDVTASSALPDALIIHAVRVYA